MIIDYARSRPLRPSNILDPLLQPDRTIFPFHIEHKASAKGYSLYVEFDKESKNPLGNPSRKDWLAAIKDQIMVRNVANESGAVRHAILSEHHSHADVDLTLLVDLSACPSFFPAFRSDSRTVPTSLSVFIDNFPVSHTLPFSSFPCQPSLLRLGSKSSLPDDLDQFLCRSAHLAPSIDFGERDLGQQQSWGRSR